MRIVVDTNVFVSGVFFGGPPGEIVEAWRKERFEVAFFALVVPAVVTEILAEYRRVGEELSARYPAADFESRLELATARSVPIVAPPLKAQVCSDPDDDMFLACALAGHATLVTSGDKALLAASGFLGIEVLTPRQFVDSYLKQDRPPQ